MLSLENTAGTLCCVSLNDVKGKLTGVYYRPVITTTHC